MAGTALTIATVARQLGATLLEDTARHEYRMNIRSESSSRLYVVARQKSDKQWQCSCMGWIRHRNCKHLTAMVPLLTAATTPRAIPGRR